MLSLLYLVSCGFSKKYSLAPELCESSSAAEGCDFNKGNARKSSFGQNAGTKPPHTNLPAIVGVTRGFSARSTIKVRARLVLKQRSSMSE